MPCSSGKAQSSKFHHHALERLLRAFDRHFQQLQDDRLVLAKHLAGGDAEQQGITDLAGGTGDGHADGFLAHGRLLNSRGQWGLGQTRNSTPAADTTLMSYVRQ
jgi:hypothetical protein